MEYNNIAAHARALEQQADALLKLQPKLIDDIESVQVIKAAHSQMIATAAALRFDDIPNSRRERMYLASPEAE